jgi:hypothetical protein
LIRAVRVARLVLVSILLGTSLLRSQAAPASQPAPPGSQLGALPANPSSERALLDRYCVPCHNERIKTAGLLLDTMDVGQIGAHAEVWERVVRRLRARTMPPARARRPAETDYTLLVSKLEKALDEAGDEQLRCTG